MEKLSWVCLGSALGGGMRYLVTLTALRLLGPSFPFGTLAVNVAGSFLIGAIMQVAVTSAVISPTVRLFLTTGIMGGLTTYSTFNYETLEFLRNGALSTGLLNLAVTVIACLAFGMLGLATGRWVMASWTVAN